MKYDLDHGLELLQHTPGTLESLLAGLSAEWLAADEGPDTWNPWDVVAHLTDLERSDWLIRVKIVLEHGRRRVFDPVERGAFRSRLEGRSVESLLEEFASLRRDNLETLRGLELGADQLALHGAHPTLGDVHLSQLLSAWVVHDLTHITQIARVMARQYDSAVGPWKEYLTVLHR
jgi:hypothetical protein